MGFSIIPENVNFDFIRFFKPALVISWIFIAIGLGSLIMKGGPRYGVDFAGGVIVQMQFAQEVKIDALTAALEKTGLPGMAVQQLGAATDNEVLARTSASDIPSEQVKERVVKAVSEGLPGATFEIKRMEAVGPKVGADLRTKALEALYYAILLISIYISGRFEHRWLAAAAMAAGLWGGLYLIGLTGAPMQWMILAALGLTLVLCWKLKLAFALGAVVALVHDTLLTVGVLSVLNREIDLTVIAALLTLLGYSLNDTIIVFDRIREALANNAKKQAPLKEIINGSVNQTLSRTILTSGLTFLTVLSLFLFGGSVINDFALTLVVGIVVGTYSSIYIASPILLWFQPAVPVDESPEQTEAARA